MAITEFKSRRKTKRLLYSPATVVVLILVIAVLARATWGIYLKYRLSADRLSQAQGQLETLNDQGADLSQSISQLSTEEGSEAVMRTDFRVTKPGESLAVIVNTATTGPATTTETFWQRVGAWFEEIF